MWLEAVIWWKDDDKKPLWNDALVHTLWGKSYLNWNVFGFSIIDWCIFCVDDKWEKLSFYKITDEVRNINKRWFNFWLNPKRSWEKIFPHFTTQTIVIDWKQWMFIYWWENNDSFVTDWKMIYLKWTYNYTLVSQKVSIKWKK